ncbi:MAG: amidohydrolase [Planctomycetes bacterium]|nr:amidohydrolase [Planctomycetota bacterium]
MPKRCIFILLCGFILCINVPGFAQSDMDQNKQLALRWVDVHQVPLDTAAQAIWEFAETALLEHKSAEYLADMLERDGFTVERGVADLPTAFVATYGSGRPVIGILAEYDALPGLSQKIDTAFKDALKSGQPGHGCGHNLFGVASSGAAMAIKSVMQKQNLKGTIKLFGCPAEETVVGKVYMAKAGLYDDLDLCFDWHPGSKNQVSLGTSNALNNFEVTYHGKTAHGAGDPWNGRSALDAVELLNIGVNFLREHVEPTVRIHYVIPNAGQAPNVVPDYAKVWYYVRDKDRKGVEHVYQRVLKIAEGAALMTETTHEVYLTTGVYNKMVNRTVAEVMYKNLELVGPPKFTEQEQVFARNLQKTFDKEQKSLTDKIEEFKEPEKYMGGGSTDVADVSWLVPTASLSVACWPLDTPGHSWGIVTCTGSQIGMKGMHVAAKTLAASGIEVLMDPSIIERAREEFQKSTEGFTYKSAIPKNQKPRLPVIKK